jgi:AcrR family transcriptional regulator
MSKSTSRRVRQTDATRSALLAAARARFAEHGFAGTSISDIAGDAGLTKGAVYHHFTSKEHLFELVFEAMEAELAARGAEAARGGTDPLDALARGFESFLDAALEPDVRRIVLTDGPAVLGTARYQELDEQYAYAGVVAAIEGAARRGLLRPVDPDALARLLLGACASAGGLVARADDPVAARDRTGRTLRALITGLAADSAL